MTTEASSATDTTEALDPNVALPTPDVDTTTTDASAQSSSADTPDANNAPPTNLLDVVKNAVKPVTAEPAASSAVTSQDPTPAEAEKPKDGEPEAEVPFHNHPRWKQMIAERDELRPHAEGFKKITSFMETSGLSSAEVDEGFQIMAKLKSGDPAVLADALTWFQARTDALATHLGHTLPADLQQKVTDGLIDEADARELAQTRAKAALLEGQNTARDTRTAEERQAAEVEATRTAMVTAVNDWETQTKATDPDYATKAAMIDHTARAIVQRTNHPPRNAEEGVALAKAAYEEVNRLLKPLVPRPKVIIPPPAGLSARVTAQPTSMKEAIRLALQK